MGRALVNSPVEAKAAGVPTVYYVIKRINYKGGVIFYYAANGSIDDLDSATRFSTREAAQEKISEINGNAYFQIEEIWQTFSR